MRRPLPSSFPYTVSSIAAGVNWHASIDASVKLHFMHTTDAEDIVLNGRQRHSEDALLLQFQLIF